MHNREKLRCLWKYRQGENGNEKERRKKGEKSDTIVNSENVVSGIVMRNSF